MQLGLFFFSFLFLLLFFFASLILNATKNPKLWNIFLLYILTIHSSLYVFIEFLKMVIKYHFTIYQKVKKKKKYSCDHTFVEIWSNFDSNHMMIKIWKGKERKGKEEPCNYTFETIATNIIRIMNDNNNNSLLLLIYI